MSEVGTHLSAPPPVGGPQWHVLWTRSNCEQRVCDELTAKGLEVFFPRMSTWSRRGEHRSVAQVPMFPGYLFLRHLMDKASYVAVARSSGLVSVLGERWDRLETVPEAEIDAIQRILRPRVPVFPHAYLCEGQRVRITRGPLADVEGIFVRGNPKKGLVVISINMLCRSVAAEVDCTLVAAA